MEFVADHQPPEITEPGKQALDFPSAPVAPQFPTVLGPRLFPVSAVRCNHLDSAVMEKPLIQPIAIVGLVANEPIRSKLGKSTIDGGLDQLHFVGRSAFHVDGDRNTSSVCDGHDLGAFAALCLADSRAPFFAGTKVPSMKASQMSMPPRSAKSCASSSTMRWKTPWRTYYWNRLWQFW